MMAGAQTEASRSWNWALTAAVSTSRLAPSGSLDWGPNFSRLAPGNPLLSSSAYTWASHPTTAARLTSRITQVTAWFLTAASVSSDGLVPGWLAVICLGDAPRWGKTVA